MKESHRERLKNAARTILAVRHDIRHVYILKGMPAETAERWLDTLTTIRKELLREVHKPNT